MTLLTGSLVMLAIGAAMPLALYRQPRLALLSGMAAMSLACAMILMIACGVLAGASQPATACEWGLPLGRAVLAIDALSAWFLLTIGTLGVPVAIYSVRYMRDEREPHVTPVFSSLMCVLVASLILLVVAADIVLFLAAWEAMTLSAFLLVMLHDRSEEVRRAGWMYLIATHLGTALALLPMFGMLWVINGGSGFATLPAQFAAASTAVLAILFVLGLLGFGTKAGFMPMHVWLPVAHPAAPTPVSALLSGVVIKTGIYGLLRLLTWLPPLPVWCGLALLAVGAISGVMGVLYALAQHDLKRLLAYHSVENIGIIGIAIGIGMLGESLGRPALIVLGYAGALLHVLNHALFKGLLFLSAGAVIHSAGTGEIDRLGGRIRTMPVNAILFLIAAVSICGLPPFNGFVSEWVIYNALFQGSFTLSRASAGSAVLSLAALALMGGLALACFAKVFSIVFLGEPRDTSLPAHPTPRFMLAGMIIPAVLCVLIGLAPGPMIQLSQRAVGVAGGLDTAQLPTILGGTMASAVWLSLMAAILLAIIGLLVWLRSRTAARAATADVSTWGCGFASPSPRIQYTASSFAWSILTSFRGVLWTDRHVDPPEGLFPAAGRLHTHTPDAAEADLFSPLFGACAAVARAAQLHPSGRAHPAEARPLRMAVGRLVYAIRRGNIQICLTYIVVTLVLVFAAEALWTPGVKNVAPSPPPGAPGVLRQSE